VKYAFIAAHRKEFHLRRMCRVLRVSASGFYEWRTREKSQREIDNCRLVEEIKAIFESSNKTYGFRRIWKELRDDEESCSKKRVLRLMRIHGIRPEIKPKFRVTTDSEHDLPVAQNLLNRDFNCSSGPNKVWVSDITYIWTSEGWLYLGVVIDLFHREVVGWSMSERIDRKLVVDALNMAVSRRRPGAGLIHHSDRGSQYASREYQKALKSYGMVCSMSRKGDCWDNAVAESFFGTLKTELIHKRIYRTRQQARREVFEYIEVFYNRTRLHSTLGYRSPAQFLAAASSKAA
jgi:transposase InsO family protein